MRQRGKRTSFQERLEIKERAEAGQSDPEISRAVGCSAWTVRKWRRVSEREGQSGLSTQLGRPSTGTLGTFSSELRARILQLRWDYPGWGPDTLLIALRTDPYWSTQRLPSRSRLAAFLKEQGLTRRYQRHTYLPQPERRTPQQAHEEWQMDAQCNKKVKGLGTVSVIDVIDVKSRTKVESTPRHRVRKPATDDYYVSLRRAFLSYGRPLRLSLDHDTVFFDNTTPSPFPTRLHLWLIGLGVEVIFTRKRRPTDHAQVERNHQTMARQTLVGQTWPTQTALWHGLDERRAVLNHYFPARALHHQSPFQAFPDAPYSGRPYRPEWEKDLFETARVYRYLAQGRWFRRVRGNGHFMMGGYEYHIGNRFCRREVEITFDADRVVFVCKPEGCDELFDIPPQGLTKTDLMGDMALLMELPVYQLALPFTVEDQRRADLIGLISGTTF